MSKKKPEGSLLATYIALAFILSIIVLIFLALFGLGIGF